MKRWLETFQIDWNKAKGTQSVICFHASQCRLSRLNVSKVVYNQLKSFTLEKNASWLVVSYLERSKGKQKLYQRRVGPPGEEKSGPWLQGTSPGVTPAPSPFSHDGGVKTKEHKH